MTEKTDSRGKNVSRRNHSFGRAAALIIGYTLFSEVVCGMIAAATLSKGFGADRNFAGGIGAVIGGILSLLIYRRRHREEYRPCAAGERLGESFRMLAPIIGLWVVISVMYGVYAGGIPFRPLSPKDIALAMTAGVVEEICFREIGISYLFRRNPDGPHTGKEENRILPIVIFTSLLFGLIHIINVGLGGTPLIDTFGQILICVFAGFFYAGVFFRNGNVWPLIIVHVLHDELVFSAQKGIPEEITLPRWTDAVLIAAFAALGLYGLYLVREAKKAEIMSLWEKFGQ